MRFHLNWFFFNISRKIKLSIAQNMTTIQLKNKTTVHWSFSLVYIVISCLIYKCRSTDVTLYVHINLCNIQIGPVYLKWLRILVYISHIMNFQTLKGHIHPLLTILIIKKHAPLSAFGINLYMMPEHILWIYHPWW